MEVYFPHLKSQNAIHEIIAIFNKIKYQSFA
ncbi:hypothetical protein ABID22_003829 [Pontibacter aydingkolensis]